MAQIIQRALGCLQQVGSLKEQAMEAVGKAAHRAEDRSFPGLLDRPVGKGIACFEHLGQHLKGKRRGHAVFHIGGGFFEAREILGKYRPAVAPGAKQGGLAEL